MKRLPLVVVAAAVIAFGAGYLSNPPVVEASGGASGVTLGTGSGGAVGVSGPQAITGPLSVTGTVSCTSDETVGGNLSVTGNTAVTGTLGVTGAATLKAGLTVTQSTTNGSAVTATGNGTGSGVSGTAGAASGLGGTFTNTQNGYAIRITGDTTSPTAASIRMDALDTNPSAAASFGDLFTYLSGSTLALRMATATTPRWDDVGSFFSVTTSVTAHAGGGQGSATAICATPLTTVSTVATAADSVILPTTPILGKICETKNKGANAMALFPASGASLCVDGAGCLGANTSTSVAANASIRCWAESSTVWNCR